MLERAKEKDVRVVEKKDEGKIIKQKIESY